ncbi:MAG: hypothetical protein QF780_09970 [Candidatus Marinimicrobia bacterium]|nr:hypothetical protein [Candidatus Neomarinimicrobiota bacterium]|tara:strand:+ start:94 stop:1263 length:1170 start_codon:yes stop_codon:yes gene_type:complete
MSIINKITLPIILLVGTIQPMRGQNVNLNGDIFEYATYYVNSFDFNTGATNVQIFRYELTSEEYPVSIKARFRATILSPSLGINNVQTIIEIETDPFQLQAPLILDNRDLSGSTSIIYDMDSPPNSIELNGNIIEILDPGQVDAITQSVLTSGQIADGEYSFEITILSEDDQILASDSKTFLVQSPVSITLESPAGALSDTLDNVIYTTFPIFQWFSQTCNGCNTFIRVAQYNSQVHSSVEDAMEDQRVLPFDQTEEWYEIDNVNSFQYPFSGAYPLEEGNVYCWQIMKSIPTTAGTEEMTSTIAAFKIGEADNIEIPDLVTNPLLMALQQALGDDQFNAYFGSGNDFQGFNPTGQVEVNGVTVDESSVNYILNQISSNAYQIQSMSVE